MGAQRSRSGGQHSSGIGIVMNGWQHIQDMRVGQGFDVHRFSDDPDRPLVLGGVRIDGTPGLVGHSDADVVAHACADALLGAAGLGDIGEHFPDTDPVWKGADSLRILEQVASMVCEIPKLAPHRSEMQERLSRVAGAAITVKGRRAEGLGALGRREGIACWSSAVIYRIEDRGEV